MKKDVDIWKKLRYTKYRSDERKQLNVSCAIVVQLVVRHLAKVEVAGSSPVCRSEKDVAGSCYAIVVQLVVRHLAKVEVAGSSPVCRSELTICNVFLLYLFFNRLYYFVSIREYD